VILDRESNINANPHPQLILMKLSMTLTPGAAIEYDQLPQKQSTFGSENKSTKTTLDKGVTKQQARIKTMLPNSALV
jgi:hypothetical protein